jgi:hypothetical protein
LVVVKSLHIFASLNVNNKTMNNTTNTQTLLITTYEKRNIGFEEMMSAIDPDKQAMEKYLQQNSGRVKLSAEEMEMDIFDVMEKHFPYQPSGLQKKVTAHIIEIAQELGCKEEAVAFTSKQYITLNELNAYFSALMHVAYSTQSKAA